MKQIINYALVTFLWLFSFSTIAQTPAGLQMEDAVYDSLPMLTYYPLNERGGDLPEEVDLKSFCPTPADQGDLATCVGHALAHALSICLALQSPEKDLASKEYSFSAFYIFNQIRLDNDCLNGAYLSKGMELLRAQGCCLQDDFPYACNYLPDKYHKQKALPYRIAKYERLFPSNASEKMKLDQIRVSLAMKGPVVVGMYVPAEMRGYPLKGNPWAADAPKVGHAWVVVGYDELTKEFELLNSYGADWGENGFIRLSYDDMAANVRYAYWLEMP